MSSFSDDFNRADGSLGANYYSVSGTLAIATNKVQQSSVTGSPAWVTYVNALATANQRARIKATTYDNTQFLYLFVRFDGPNDNGYGAEVNSDFINIVKYVSGTPTVLGSGSAVTAVSGDAFDLTAVDDALSFYQNGSLIYSTTDSTYSSGGTGGFGLKAVSSVSNIELKDFLTEDITSGPPVGSLMLLGVGR